MKQTIDKYDFQQAFQEIRPDSFSYDGLLALFNYLDEFNDDMELDVIELDCTYSESTLEDLVANYGYMTDDTLDMAEWADFLSDHTTVIPVDSETVIVKGF